MNAIGILLAAGRGRRMGGNKQFHLVQTTDGEKPLVAAAFDTIAGVCVQMYVVLGHRAEEVATALGDRKFVLKKGSELFSNAENSSDPFLIVDPDAPMFNSICAGLQAALNPSRSGNQHSILLQLGDHPAVERSTLEEIFALAEANPAKAIMPTFQGKGGHPVLIPPSVAEKILATPCPDGLRGFWLDQTELCIRFEVNDPGVTRDIDTI